MKKGNWTYDADRVLQGALFGCGQVAKYHMRGWEEIPNVKITAVANRTIEKAYALAGQFDIDKTHVYSSPEDLLKNETVDFIDIATLPDQHFEQVKAAADRGCHILCQKPFAPSLRIAGEMIQAADDAGVLLSVNENWRWRRWYREIKRILAGGGIGKPRYCCIKRHSNITLPGKNGELPALFLKQPYTRELEKLLIYEWGIHLIDVSRYLFGEAERIYASTGKVSTYFTGEDRAVISLEKKDMQTLIDISWGSTASEDVQNQLEEIIIEGDEGMILLLPQEDERIRIRNGKGEYGTAAMEYSPAREYQNSYTNAQQHFISCLRKGEYPETHADDNLKTLAYMFAAYDSAKTHSVIELRMEND